MTEEVKDSVVLSKDGKTVDINGETFDVGWAPFPKNPKLKSASKYSSQELFIGSWRYKEVLYHGTRGIGKTEALIASYVQFCGQGFGRAWRGVIFRKNYKSLGDLIKKSKEIIYKIHPKAEFKHSKSDLKWVFPDGEELMFAILNEDTYDNFHGQELSFIGFDEITLEKDLETYNSLKSCLRAPKKMSRDGSYEMPKMIRATTNPYGPGRAAVKRYFIDNADERGVTEETIKIGNRTYVEKRLHIRGSYLENPYLDESYEIELFKSCEGNPAKLKSWMNGDWDAVTGGMFGDHWDKDIHVMQPFAIPPQWKVDRAMDWGTASPFSVGWWAETDGCEVVLPNGEFFRPKKGSLILIHEYYGCKKGDDSKGINIPPKEVAQNILKEDKVLASKGIIRDKDLVKEGPADTNMWTNANQRGILAIADLFINEGVHIKRAIKGPGSRKNGAQMFRQMLQNTLDGSGPGIYVFSTCKHWINHVPIIEIDDKDPEDTLEGGLDHDYDMTRYRIMEKARTVVMKGLK